MNLIMAMARKDIKLIFTSKAAVFFTFIFPLLFMLLFGGLMGGDKSDRKISVALVLPSKLEKCALAFVNDLRQSPDLTITELDLETAKTAVRKGKYSAYVELPEDFSAQWQTMFSGSPPQVHIGADPSRSAESAMLEGLLMKYGAKRFEQMFSLSPQSIDQLQITIDDIAKNDTMDSEWKALLGDYLPRIKNLMSEQQTKNAEASKTSTAKGPDMRPIDVQHVDIVKQQNGPTNAYSVLVPQAVVWAMLGGMMGFGVSLAKERSRGTLVRLLAAPMPARHILFGKAAACIMTLLFVATCLMTLGVVVFKVPIQNALLLTLAVIAVVVMFTGLMLALTVIAKTEEAIGGGGWGVFMVMSMIGGNMVPLFLMPSWMQTVALISPIRWAIVSLEGAIWRQYSFTEMLLPLGVCLGLAAASYALAIQRFKRDWVAP